MTHYCALPPVDLSIAHIGRGNGRGWNRLHTRADQYHAGLDFMAGAGTPIHAVCPGTVVAIGLDANRPGAGGLDGYGNCVVVQCNYSLPVPTSPIPGQSRPPTRGMPNPFWVLYAHMGSPPVVRIGQHVDAGTLLGYVGNTTNGRFSGPNCSAPPRSCGMGPHLHFEVRKSPFPSSYDNDTINPDLLFASLGIDRVGSHPDAERQTGGNLLIRAGGPSDCGPGVSSELHGWLGDPVTSGQASAGSSYLSPSAISSKYVPGTTPASIPDVDPPDYKSIQPSGPSPVLVVGGIFAAVGVAYVVARKRKRR